MRYFLALFFVTWSLVPQKSAIQQVREQFFQVCDKKKDLASWASELKEYENSNYLIIAYKGVASAMYAEIASGVYSKLKYFSTGTKMLDRVIEKFPRDIEPRFLRLTIQKNAPGFLNYNDNIEEDKNKIISGFSEAKTNKASPLLMSNIKKYLTENKLCSEKELKNL